MVLPFLAFPRSGHSSIHTSAQGTNHRIETRKINTASSISPRLHLVSVSPRTPDMTLQTDYLEDHTHTYYSIPGSRSEVETTT